MNITKETIGDFVMAHRYMYYVMCSPIISDHSYDQWEALALETVPENHPLRSPGSDRPEHYSPAVITLAGVLRAKV